MKREKEEEEKKRLAEEQRKAQENKKSKFQKFWDDFKNKLLSNSETFSISISSR